MVANEFVYITSERINFLQLVISIEMFIDKP